MSELAARIRTAAADATDWHGETMKQWDKIRRTVETHKGSDLPRLMFEALVESLAELMTEGADEIERLASRPSPEWQPISSAPKDGTVILGCSGDGSDYRVFSMKWDIESEHGSYGWIDPDWDGGYDPVNWQPLPQPPHPEQQLKDANRG